MRWFLWSWIGCSCTDRASGSWDLRRCSCFCHTLGSAALVAFGRRCRYGSYIREAERRFTTAHQRTELQRARNEWNRGGAQERMALRRLNNDRNYEGSTARNKSPKRALRCSKKRKDEGSAAREEVSSARSDWSPGVTPDHRLPADTKSLLGSTHIPILPKLIITIRLLSDTLFMPWAGGFGKHARVTL